MSLIEDLNWRYATKKMNGKTVPQDKIDYILEATLMAPSSSGLQPYRVFLISNKELREKMLPIASGQSQIMDASHVLVFAAWDSYSLAKIENVFDRTLTERGLPLNAMDDYKKNLWGIFEPQPNEAHAHHTAKQSYIALGIAMAAAAEQKVDATPMEGFNPAKLDELLGLPALGLKSTVVLTLGYRDEANDWLVNMKKVRIPKDEFITELD